MVEMVSEKIIDFIVNSMSQQLSDKLILVINKRKYNAKDMLFFRYINNYYLNDSERNTQLRIIMILREYDLKFQNIQETDDKTNLHLIDEFLYAFLQVFDPIKDIDRS